jgi:hypothetical protein
VAVGNKIVHRDLEGKLGVVAGHDELDANQASSLDANGAAVFDDTCRGGSSSESDLDLITDA